MYLILLLLTGWWTCGFLLYSHLAASNMYIRIIFGVMFLLFHITIMYKKPYFVDSINILKFLPISFIVRAKNIKYGNISSDLVNSLPGDLMDIFNGKFGQESCTENNIKYFILRNKDIFILCFWNIGTQIRSDWENKFLTWISNNKSLQIINDHDNVVFSSANFHKSSYTTITTLDSYILLENSIQNISLEANESASHGFIVLDSMNRVLYINRYIRDILKPTSLETTLKTWNCDELEKILRSQHDTKFFSKINGNMFNCHVIFKKGWICIYLYLSIDTPLLKNNRLSIIGEMSVGACHDINNIIAILLILLDGIMEKYEDEVVFLKCRQFLFKIKVLTNRILSLFTQNAENKNEPYLEITGALEEWIKSLNQVNSHVNIRFSNSLSEVYARIDEFYFGQMIFNIMKNAIDVVKDEPNGLITIECNRVSIENSIVENNYFVSSGKYVKITISNNGVRITNDQVNKIFVQSGNSTKDEGHGIGLTIVLDIIRRHNGLLRIGNKERTEFVIYLPEYEQSLKKITSDSLYRILVIEDEKMLRNVICSWLQAAGHATTGIDNIEEAEKKLYTEVIDLVVIDLHVNGVYSEPLIRKFMTTKKILIISGDYGNRGFVHDNVSYLSKPFTKDSLIKVIKGIFG